MEKSKIEEGKQSKTSLSDLIKERDYTGIEQQLSDGLSDYLERETYTRYLQLVSAFHQYPVESIQLMLAQNRQVSQLAELHTWKKMERKVKEGEKALYVYAPLITDKKNKEGHLLTNDDGEPLTTTRYLLKPVFDVSQTEGDTPLLSLVTNIEEQLSDPNQFLSYYKLLDQLTTAKVKIEPLSTSVNGYYLPENNQIVIKEGLGEVMTLKVLLHEMTNARLYANSSELSDGDVYSKQAFEVESVTYIVSQHLGLDTSEYTFSYLDSWTDKGHDLETLSKSLRTVTNEAKKLISEVDSTIKKIVLLDAPQNKFEERIAIARNKQPPSPRTPKKEFEQVKEKQKKTVDTALKGRLSQQS